MRRALLLTFLLVALPAAVAHASQVKLIHDCQDGSLSGHYSQKELRSALANLPSDVDEYTNCRDVIRAAQLSAASGNNGGGGPSTGGGSTGTGSTGTGGTATGGATTGGTNQRDTGRSPGAFGGFSGYPADPVAGATKQERAAVDAAQAVPAERTAVAASTLPGPLIVALALGALGLLVLGAHDLRRRVLARRGP